MEHIGRDSLVEARHRGLEAVAVDASGLCVRQRLCEEMSDALRGGKDMPELLDVLYGRGCEVSKLGRRLPAAWWRPRQRCGVRSPSLPLALAALLLLDVSHYEASLGACACGVRGVQSGDSSRVR